LKQKFIKSISFLLALTLLSQVCSADDTANIDGGGGEMGQGTSSNVWAVASQGGGVIYDAEGFRVYLVNSSTGAPVSTVIDITNSNVAKTGVRNGRGKTKYEYTHINSSLSNFNEDYQYVKVQTSPQKLPQIIPWDEGSSAARIDAIKEWFLTGNYSDWVLAQLGSNIDEVRAGGYLLAIEPIAYFRYNGIDYAMTATEAAIFDEAAGGDLRNKMGPLTHKNLPLSVFLEEAEFTSSSNRIDAWTGSRTNSASNENIRKYLGIGFIHYVPGELTEGEALFSYPTDTWVVTSFRLCNVIWDGSAWVEGGNITSMNPAKAKMDIDGDEYTISNIYIPSGGEQLFWVKWKTPSTPQELIITATADKGLIYNERNTSISNRYVNIITATVEIYDNDMEIEPPDPTLNDTQTSIGYSAGSSNSAKSSLLSGSSTSNSWYVWDCWLELDDEYIETYSASGHMPDYPTESFYDSETGIYYEYFEINSYTYTQRIQISQNEYTFETIYVVEVLVKEYSYRYGKVTYTAEVRNAYVKMKPDVNCPTAYTRNYETYMKSGYGVNIELETYIKITVKNDRERTISSDTYYAPASTSYAACPQYIFEYFPEFNYGTYCRQLEYYSNKYMFKKNRFSTYNERTHYTPWWYPDNQRYSVVMRSDFAYTPAGKLCLWQESNSVVIEGNLYNDWRQSPIR
jgi:hypothetical protein